MKLTNAQEKALKLLAASPLGQIFYWTGGTLLAHHYLKHRKSFDLDFFSEQPFSFGEVDLLAQAIKDAIGATKVSYKKIFDRHEFLFENKQTLRIEFVYYNHEKKTLKQRAKLHGIFIDSLDDIAANKTVALFDRNEPKDVFDLYFLLTKKGFTVDKLLAFTRQKFGVSFTEGSFWSETFKSFPLLYSLKPLVEGKTEKEAVTLLKTIEEYFKERSAAFLRKHLR